MEPPRHYLGEEPKAAQAADDAEDLREADATAGGLEEDGKGFEHLPAPRHHLPALPSELQPHSPHEMCWEPKEMPFEGHGWLWHFNGKEKTARWRIFGAGALAKDAVRAV